MKNRTLISISIFVVVVAVIIIFVSCNTTGNGDGNGVGTPGGTPTLAGTWGNPDYDGAVGGPLGKTVITDNGDGTFTFVAYDTVSDTEPLATMIKTVTDEGTDSEGNLFYKAEGPQVDPAYVYTLIKIHSDNQTMEVDSSEVDYPTEIDLDNDYYGIYYRQ